MPLVSRTIALLIVLGTPAAAVGQSVARSFRVDTTTVPGATLRSLLTGAQRLRSQSRQ